MQARNIMTSPVIRTTPDASILEAAALLVDNRISAMPVVNGDAVVGIVSEADLLRRSEIGTQRDSSTHRWWRRIFASDKGPWNYIEAHAMKIGDIMTTPVVSIGEDMPVSEIAELFESHKIKRAPVLRAERLVGIVSRSDFVRALAARAKLEHDTQPKSDESIRVALLAELESQSWWRPDRCRLIVKDGVVHYSGEYDGPEEKIAARVAAENIPGVRAVEDSRSISSVAPGYPGAGYPTRRYPTSYYL
jgi:CBS domain-containing protein